MKARERDKRRRVEGLREYFSEWNLFVSVEEVPQGNKLLANSEMLTEAGLDARDPGNFFFYFSQWFNLFF